MADTAGPPAEPRECFTCNKLETELPTGTHLKRCSRCQNVAYCSKECQATHWPQHKTACRRPGARTANPKPRHSHPLHPPLMCFFKEFDTDTKTYEMLIDTFRLRCDDDYAWGAHYHGIYGQNPPLPVFRDFLTRAKAAGMLPEWWNDDKEKECVRMAMEDEHFTINFAVEPHDIQEHYGGEHMVMTLRMVAENVYGGSYEPGVRPMPEDYECQCRGSWW